MNRTVKLIDLNAGDVFLFDGVPWLYLREMHKGTRMGILAGRLTVEGIEQICLFELMEEVDVEKKRN